MLSRITTFLTQQWLLTIALIAISSVTPFCSWIAYILITLLVLDRGYLHGLLGLVVCIALPTAVNYWQVQHIFWLPIVNPAFVTLAAFALKRYQSWSAVTDFAYACTLLITAAVVFVFPQLQKVWLGFIYWACDNITTLIQMNALTWQQMSPDPSLQLDSSVMGNWRNFTDYLREIDFFTFFPIIATSLFIVCLQLSLLVNIWLATKLNKMRFALQAIRLSRVSTLALVLVLVAANQKDILALNLILGLLIWYFIAGLSFCHWIAQQLSKILGWLWIIAVYLWISIAFKSAVIAIIFIAIIDSLINIRLYLPKIFSRTRTA
jgi:hypothetical protein